MICEVCKTDFTGTTCTTCKEKAMKNSNTIQIDEPIKTQEEADRIESVVFEDDAEVTLRDGKTYKLMPSTLKDARVLMKKLRTVNPDTIILNFIDIEIDGEEESEMSEKRINDLYDILLIAFNNYKSITKEYLERVVDVTLAKHIIDIVLGLNDIKK